MTREHRIVVFTGNPAYSVRKGIVEIDRAIPGLTWLVLIHRPKKSVQRLLKNQWHNLRRNGWRWIPYQATDIWNRLTERPATKPDATFPGTELTLAALESRPNMQVVEVNDIHAQTTLERVHAFAPDLGLSLAAPILRRPLFAIPRHGSLNLHKGKVPDYRGMPPAFWELWNDEQSIGCTVHRVDDKLDTGDLVRTATVARARFSTLRGLQLCLDEVGVGLMCEAVKDTLLGTPADHPQAAGGRTYRKPTLAQVTTLESRMTHEAGTKNSPTRLLKDAVFALGSRAWHLGLRHLTKPRITVLLYHRVSDDVRDNLTVGIEQFDRQMALLRKHCQPLSIQQVIACRSIPHSGLPLVAVTFDDGYLDNYQNAAPILMRHGIPAAFFVSTGLMNTKNRFPHDLRRGNPPIPLMTWDQLRAMRDSGFTIGSHSVNHIDCAAESEETVRDELARSRDDLRRELGLTDCLFAYPYGGKRHMTPQRLELVKQAGYSGCLAAYGGSNVGGIDPYNVLRRGIHWEFSDRAFQFECLGL